MEPEFSVDTVSVSPGAAQLGAVDTKTAVDRVGRRSEAFGISRKYVAARREGQRLRRPVQHRLANERQVRSLGLRSGLAREDFCQPGDVSCRPLRANSTLSGRLAQ